MAKHDVFLSYSHEDSAAMLEIKGLILESGLTVWTDEGITAGTQSWRDAIQTSIENAGCVIVIFSPSSKNSFWVKEELSYASAQNKTILPVLIAGDERTAVPFGYSSTQYVDLRDGKTQLKERLVPVVGELLGKTDIVDPHQIFLIVSWFGIQSITEAIIQVAQRVGFKVITGQILSDDTYFEASILKAIRSSRIVIVDLSYTSANVYFEYGYARGLDKPIIAIAKENADFSADIIRYQTVIYRDSTSLEADLQNILVNSQF